MIRFKFLNREKTFDYKYSLESEQNRYKLYERVSHTLHETRKSRKQ